jgi:hypothetical protein
VEVFPICHHSFFRRYHCVSNLSGFAKLFVGSFSLILLVYSSYKNTFQRGCRLYNSFLTILFSLLITISNWYSVLFCSYLLVPCRVFNFVFFLLLIWFGVKTRIHNFIISVVFALFYVLGHMIRIKRPKFLVSMILICIWI